MLIRYLVALLLFLATPVTAWPQAAITGAFQPAPTSTSISATTTSSNVSLPGTGPVAVVFNSGSVTAYVATGGSSTLVATTSSFPIPAGFAVAIAIPAPGFMAGITASGSTTLQVTQGSGGPNMAFSAAVSGGGTVTANQGTVPWVVAGNGTAGTAAAGVLSIQGITSMTPVQVSQATAASLNATVVGTGTFAVQATQSGTWTVQPGNTPNTTPWLTTNTPSSASAGGTTAVSTSALAANLVVKAGAGNLYGLQVSADGTLSGAAWWLMLYNLTSAPVDGAVTPAKCYAMPSGATSVSFAFPTPAFFSTGITAGVSTTGCFNKTASTHAFISGDAQ